MEFYNIFHTLLFLSLGPEKESLKDDIHRPAKNIRQTKETEKLKEKLEVSKDKRRINQKLRYSKTCVKRPLSKRPKIDFRDQLSLNAGQKYCRMHHLDHSAILSTFIKLLIVIKIFVLSIFEWSFYTDFTVYNFILSSKDLTIYIYHVVSSFGISPLEVTYPLLITFAKNLNPDQAHKMMGLIWTQAVCDVKTLLHKTYCVTFISMLEKL